MGDVKRGSIGPDPIDREVLLRDLGPSRQWSQKEVDRYLREHEARSSSVTSPAKDFGIVAGSIVRVLEAAAYPWLGIFGRIRLGSRLHRPPGYGLLWVADFFYSKKSVEECLRPTIQDLQDEYAEALAANRPHKARWVRIRGTWSFACAAGLLTMASIGKQVVKIWKAVG